MEEDKSVDVVEHQNANEDVMPSEDDKKEFLRSVLGGRPFIKEYTALEGGLVLRYSSLSVSESQSVERAMHKEIKELEDKGKPTDVERVNVAIKARLCALLREVRMGDDKREWKLPGDGRWTPSAMYTERFGDLPDPIMFVVVRRLGNFEKLVDNLPRTIPDF